MNIRNFSTVGVQSLLVLVLDYGFLPLSIKSYRWYCDKY